MKIQAGSTDSFEKWAPVVTDHLDFEVREHLSDGQVVVDLGGEVDVYNAPRLRNELARVFQEGGLDIVLVVENLDFVDVTGLGVIIAAAKRIGDAGGHVTLRDPTRAVERIVDLTQQHHFLSVIKSARAAGAA